MHHNGRVSTRASIFVPSHLESGFDIVDFVARWEVRRWSVLTGSRVGQLVDQR